MSQGVTNWAEVGFFPLQDHEDGVPIGMRQQMAGVRIHSMLDPSKSDDADATSHTIGTEDDMGTAGDIGPWFYWQTRDRDERATGAWSQVFSAISVSGSAGPAAGRTGTPAKPTGYLPYRTAVHGADGRMKEKFPNWPKSFPRIPHGVEGLVMPGIEESTQHELFLHADPRIMCPGVEGPGDAGTLIVDLQPENEPCMAGATKPGTKGRAARIQSMMRVIALNNNSSGPLGAAPYPSLAWNLALSQQEKLLGYGMVWAMTEGGGGTGPITGGPVTVAPPGPITPMREGYGALLEEGGGDSGPSLNFSGGSGPQEGKGKGKHEEDGTTPDDFGTFRAKPKASHGVGFMAQVGACGPFTIGAGAGDKHTVGSDADGNSMTSGHVSTNAYFFADGHYDAPLAFEKAEYPKDVKELPIKVKVHLQYDSSESHKWIQGSKPGLWKWWSTSNVVTPMTPMSMTPMSVTPMSVTPVSPMTPGPMTPMTPGPVTPVTPMTGMTTGGPVQSTGPITHGGPRAPSVPAPRGGSYGWPGPITGGPRGGPISGGSTPMSSSGSGTGSGDDEDDDDTPMSCSGTPGSSDGGDKEPDDGGDGGGGSSGGGGYYDGPGGFNPGSWMWRYGKWRPGRRPRANDGGPMDNTSMDASGHDETWNKVDVAAVDTFGASSGSTGLNALYHPMMEGFSAMSFRAPLIVNGGLSLEHSSGLTEDYPTGFTDDDALCVEASAAAVLAGHAFGGLDDSGNYNYADTPETSNSRGGTASGGFMFHPAGFELDDYFGFNSAKDVTAPNTTSFVLAAPGVGFGIGLPNLDGSIQDGGGIIKVNPSIPTWQVMDSGAAVTVFTTQIDSGEPYVNFAGTGSMRIPTGTTGERPAISLDGEIRINETTVALEFYENSTWNSLAPGAGATTYLALTDTPGSFASQALKYARVNAGETAIEFATFPSIPSALLDLSDTPATYGISGDHLVSDGAGIVWETPTPPAVPTYLGLSDAPSTFTGDTLQLVRVNAGETALEHVDGDTLYTPTAQVFEKDGSVTATGAFNMGANKVSNLGAGAVAGDAVEIVQAVTAFMPNTGGTFTGAVTHSVGDLTLNDSIRATFGTGGDADIWYDGTDLRVDPAVVGSGKMLFADSKKIAFGTGKDAEIYYDGTHLIIDPKVAGTGAIAVPGDIEVADGYSTTGTERNAHITCWEDNAFGMELFGGTGGPALAVFGRSTDSAAILFGTYTADSTAQNDFTELMRLEPSGDLGIGKTPGAFKLDVNGDVNADGYSSGGTAGIDKSQFNFTDNASADHQVTIVSGLITEWTITP